VEISDLDILMKLLELLAKLDLCKQTDLHFLRSLIIDRIVSSLK